MSAWKLKIVTILPSAANERKFTQKIFLLNVFVEMAKSNTSGKKMDEDLKKKTIPRHEPVAEEDTSHVKKMIAHFESPKR